MTELKSKIIILGSGPAGFTASIYAARAGLNPCLISGFYKGGQLTMASFIENFPGFPSGISGTHLMEQMEHQALNVGVHILNDKVIDVDFHTHPFILNTENKNCFQTDCLIIATGESAKWLDNKDYKKYIGHGLSTCAACDGFFYKNEIVAVVGGGNTAAEEALYLSTLSSKVYLIHRRDTMRADYVLQERLFKNQKIEIIWNSVVTDILGDENVTGILLKNVLTNNTKTIKLSGIFLAIGHTPNTSVFSPYISLDSDGYIITNPSTLETNIKGIFAAGDVQNKFYQQAIIAAGSGATAAMSAQRYLSEFSHRHFIDSESKKYF